MEPNKNLSIKSDIHRNFKQVTFSIPELDGKVQEPNKFINPQMGILGTKLLLKIPLKATSKQAQTLSQLRALLPFIDAGETLENMQFPLELSTCLDRKIAFHMLSDYWGKGKKNEDGELLEGLSSADLILKYMQGLVTFSGKNEILIQHYQQAAEMAKKIEAVSPEEFVNFINNDLFSSLKTLPANSMLFIHIGWSGIITQYPFVEHSGHSMMLQIIKTESGNFILRLLNTGSGLEFHIGIKVELKQKYSPCCEWSLTSDALYNLTLWKSILEPRMIPRWYPKERPYFSKENIYLQLEQHLGSPISKRNLSIDFFISSQRAGTCIKKSADLIARLFLEKAAYKRNKIESNLYTLAMLHQKWNLPQDPLHHDPIILEIMHKGVEGAEGALIRAIRNQDFTQHQAEQNHAIAVLSDLIEAIESDVSLFKSMPSRAEEYLQLEAMKFSDGSLVENRKAFIEISSIVQERHGKLFVPRINGNLGIKLEECTLKFPTEYHDIKSFLDSLQDIAENLTLLEQRPPYEAVAYIKYNVLDILPIPSIIATESEYSLFSAKEALFFCISLRKIANHLFYWTMGKARQILPEHTVAFWKIYAIGIELALKSDPTLKNQKFNWINLNKFLESRRVLTACEAERDQLESLKLLFENHSPGGGDIAFSSKAPFFAFYLPSLHILGYPREDFVQLAEWQWLESHLSVELIQTVQVYGQNGKDIEEVLKFLTKQSFKKGIPAYIVEYIALRDMAYYAMSSCQPEPIHKDIIQRSYPNDYEMDSGHDDFFDYHSQCWMDIKELQRIMSDSRKRIFKSSSLEKTWSQGEKFAKNFPLAVFVDEFFAKKSLKQPEIWRRSILEKNRQELAGITAQTSYDFSIISEAPDEVRLPLLFDLVEKEPLHLHNKDFRFYFLIHFYETGKFNDQVIHEPAFLNRVQKLLERHLLNGQRDLTNGLSLSLWEHDLFLLKITMAVRRLCPPQYTNKVSALIIRCRENLTQYLLKNEDLLRQQGAEGLLGSISHHILAMWEGWPKEKGLPEHYFSILKIAGRFPLGGIWEEARLSQQVQNVLYGFSHLIQKYSAPTSLIAFFLKDFKEEHLAEKYPFSITKISEPKNVLDLRMKIKNLKRSLTSNIEDVELYKTHLQLKIDQKEAGFEGIIIFEISGIKKKLKELSETITDLQSQINLDEKELIEMGASIEVQLPNDQWIVSFPMFTLSLKNGKVIQVDLIQGKVFHDGIEEIGSTLPSRIKENSSMVKFGDLLSQPINRVGNSYTFCDPCFAQLSFKNDDTMSVVLQWEGASYALLSKGETKKLILPTLYKESTLSYWITLDKVVGQFLICLHDNRGVPIPIFIMSSESVLSPVKQRNLFLVDISKLENVEALSLFSRLCPNMCDALPWKGLDDTLQRVELPCTTDTIAWLAFIKSEEKGHWHWEADPSYRVMPSQHFPYLSRYPYYLVLENSEGERRILINPQRVESLKLRSKGKVRQAPSIPVNLGTHIPPNGKPQENLIQYAVSNIGEPISLSIAGSLYMAYLKLLDCSYAISLELLKQSVPIGRGYTLEELDILRWILDSNKEKGDRHPGACAVRLFAAAKAINHLKNFPFKKEEKKIIEDDWSYRKPLYEFFTECSKAGEPLKIILEQDYNDYARHTLVSMEWRLDKILSYQERWSIVQFLATWVHRLPFFQESLLPLPEVPFVELPLYVLGNLEKSGIALFDGEIDEIDVEEKLFKNQTWGGHGFQKLFWYAYKIAKNKQTDSAKALMLKEILQFRKFENESNGLYKESDNKNRIEFAVKKFGNIAQEPIGISINQSLYAILNKMLDSQDISIFPDLPLKDCPEIERKTAKMAFLKALSNYYKGDKGIKVGNQFQHFVSPLSDNLKLPKVTEEKLLDYYHKMALYGTTREWRACFKNDEPYYTPEKRNKELTLACKEYPEILPLLENLSALDSFYSELGRDRIRIPKEWKLPTVNRNQVIADSAPKFLPSLSLISGCDIGVTRMETEIPNSKLVSKERCDLLNLSDHECLKPLEDALHAFNIEERRITYMIDKSHYDDLKSNIGTQINKLTEKASELEKEILRIASSLPDSWTTEQKFEHLLGRLKGSQKTFDIKACIGLVLQGLPMHWEEMVGIAPHEQYEFKKIVAEFLIYKTEIQLSQRLRKKIKDLSTASGEGEILLMQEVGQMLDSQRDYNCLHNFEILVYEYFANIRLYPKQVNVIKLLAKVQYALEPRERHRVVQLIMGAGKSQILGPILAYLAADGEHISTITATEQLYGTSKFDWSQKIYQMFSRHTETLEFNREGCSVESLKRILSMLETARREGKVVVTRPNDLLSLQMMLTEHLEQIHLIKSRYARKCKEWVVLNAILIPHEKQEALLGYLIGEKNFVKPKGLSDDIEKRISAIKTGQEKLYYECLKLHLEIDELAAILEELGENQVNLIDEYDSISHPLTQLSFPVGFSRKVPAEAIQSATELYFDWLLEKEDLLQISQGIQSAFCTSENLETVMNFIIDRVCEQEGFLKNESRVLKLYLSNVDSLETRQLYEFLKDNFETSEYKQMCNRIAFMKHVVTHELRTALKSIAHTEYALSDRDKDYELVIPCEKGEKREGARFRNPYETLLKTCQFYRQSWKRPDTTKRLLEHYLKEMEIQPVEPQIISDIKKAFDLKHFYKLPLDDVKFLDQMTLTFEFYLKSTKFEDSERHKSALKVVQTYLKEVIFPNQLTYDPCQVNGTPLDLAAIPKSNKGYSGTFANDRTWDPKVETFPDLKTDGATVSALLDPRNLNCAKMKGTSFEEKIASCVSEIKNHQKISVPLIDLGGQFRGQSPKKIVTELLNQIAKEDLQIVAILSYQKNFKGEWALTLWKRGAAEPQYIDGTNEEDIVKACQGISRKHILTYYGYPHIIGSNITHPLFSRALVTMGDKTTIDHHLQAAMRMRKLGELAHFTTFLVTQEVEDCIKGRLKIPSDQLLTGADLLQYTQIQLKEMERVRNFQGIRKQLLQVLKNRFRQQLVREKSHSIREEIYETTARPYLIKEQGGTLFQQFGQIETKVEPWDLLDQDFENLKKVISEKSVSDEMKFVLDFHKERKTPLPELVSEHMMMEQEAVEVQSQAQMLVQQKMRQEEAEMRELEKMEVDVETPWPDSISDDNLFIPLNSVQEAKINCPSIYKFINALENVDDITNSIHSFSCLDNLFLTSNFINSFVGKGNTLFTSLGKQIHHLLVVQTTDRSKAKLIFITLEESAQFIKLLRQKQDSVNCKLFVVEPHGQIIQSGCTGWENPFEMLEERHKEIRIALIQAMTMQGDARRLKEARYYMIFKEWINSLEGKQRSNIKILFEHNLSFRPDDKKIYDCNTSLQNVWKDS
ncbi:MAG: DUF3638 domain-containing protein [Parachlamydiaceae bacterium]|nr:DUF3638 domain-containing protein [Parachlamydiaceae bacterium]